MTVQGSVDGAKRGEDSLRHGGGLFLREASEFVQIASEGCRCHERETTRALAAASIGSGK